MPLDILVAFVLENGFQELIAGLCINRANALVEPLHIYTAEMNTLHDIGVPHIPQLGGTK